MGEHTFRSIAECNGVQARVYALDKGRHYVLSAPINDIFADCMKLSICDRLAALGVDCTVMDGDPVFLMSARGIPCVEDVSDKEVNKMAPYVICPAKGHWPESGFDEITGVFKRAAPNSIVMTSTVLVYEEHKVKEALAAEWQLP